MVDHPGHRMVAGKDCIEGGSASLIRNQCQGDQLATEPVELCIKKISHAASAC